MTTKNDLDQLIADRIAAVQSKRIDDKQSKRIDALCESLQSEWDTNAVLRGTIGRLEDTIEKLLGYTECGCGETLTGNYGKCVPCQIRDEGIYP